ncbi:MAG TPA: redoxin domain-containing protein [Candidatus Angelobacter sp.]
MKLDQGVPVKWNIALGACCVVLLGINIALLRQNRQLKEQVSLPPPALEVPAGMSVPDLKGFDLSGKPIELAYGKDPRKVLVLVFSPTCGFCTQNWPRWWDLMSALNRDAVRPVAVDVTSSTTAVFVAEHRLDNIAVMNQVDPTDRIHYRFQLTPQTILIDPTGKVEKVWSGVLNATAVEELKQRTGSNKPAPSGSSQTGL